MQTKLLNAVVLAEDYDATVKWYVAVFGLEIIEETRADYRYTELGAAGEHVVGIAVAEEMKLKPTIPRNNAVIIKVAVSDIQVCFKRIEKYGGEILFGPSQEG